MDVDDVYDPEEEQERLAAVIEPWYERMLAGLHEAGGQRLCGGAVPGPIPPRRRGHPDDPGGGR